MIKTSFKFGKKDRIIVLTGAGISAESGLKTFRDSDGLWENHRVEDVATPQAFIRDAELVWRFYKERYHQLTQVEPNAGHFAISRLEQHFKANFMLITQNVDDLHQRAGNERIMDMHGSLQSCFCTKCGESFRMQDIDLTPAIPLCEICGSSLRPDIVWFGEIPYYMSEIDAVLKQATYFIVIGTSGTVQPAASLVYLAKMNSAKTIGVNLQPPENLIFIDEFHLGRAGEILPVLVEKWIG